MNINITSSMKYINLEGLTPLQIIQKYEELLFQRESIIAQLSTQLNDSQQKYLEISDTIEQLTNRNKELNEEKLKCDKILNQQRIDKDLLFIKLNNLISENDKLTNIIQGKKDSKQATPSSSITLQKKDKNKDINKKQNITTSNNNNNSLRLELKKEDTKNEKNENNKIEEKKKKDEKLEKENEKSEIIEQKKNIDNNININNVINEKKEEKKEDKKEDKKEEIKSEDKKEDKKINENVKEEIKSQSEKRIITINPEEYLAKRKKKHKGGRKLMSEKISYDPVFK